MIEIAVIMVLAAFFVGLASLLLARGLRTGLPYPSCGNPRCRYDLTGSIGCADRCPECGSRFAEVGITPVGRGRNRALIVAGLAVILFPVVIGLAVSFVMMHQARLEAIRAQAARQAAIQTLPFTPSAPGRNPAILRDPDTGEVYLVDPETESSMDLNLDAYDVGKEAGEIIYEDIEDIDE